MLQKIIDFILGKKTIDGVLLRFNKDLTDLRNLELHHTQKVEDHSVEVEQALAARNQASKEAARARTVADRIATLVGADLAPNEPSLAQ